MRRLTTEEFIQKAKVLHGDKYDYSRIEYKNSKSKICIICPIHGEFWQTPGIHLHCGCPQCGGTSKSNTEEFIYKAKEVHKDKYDYSRMNYINSASKVELVCPKHGSFWQSPNRHLAGNGCPKCKDEAFGNRRRISQEVFINRANKVHNSKYDYSKTRYIDNRTKVCIVCPEHGEFWQTPNNHLHYGCIKCGGTYKINTNEFIKKAREVHGDKYDYSKVDYRTTETKITITCPIHGDFEQTPHDHIGGHGCPICGGVLHYTQEDFIRHAKEVHGEQYSYDKVEYIKSNQKVLITCPKHGDFMQLPAAHLYGVGCPKCKRSRGEEIISIVLDALNIKYEEQYRIKDSFRTRKEIVVDFYLPNNNCIIEFNGAQHYIPMEFFGGEKQLKNQQQRDEELRQYCNQNNIKLLEIPYYEKQIKETIISKLS